MAYYCGYNGRLRVAVAGVQLAVAGIKEWRRTGGTQMSPIMDFERPTNAAGLPIAGYCPGGVTVSYHVQGYFVSSPAAGVNYTADMFDVGTTLTCDFLFSKTGPVGIKLVVCTVESVEMGQAVEGGAATFSATLKQTSADPSPLVS